MLQGWFCATHVVSAHLSGVCLGVRMPCLHMFASKLAAQRGLSNSLRYEHLASVCGITFHKKETRRVRKAGLPATNHKEHVVQFNQEPGRARWLSTEGCNPTRGLCFLVTCVPFRHGSPSGWTRTVRVASFLPCSSDLAHPLAPCTALRPERT